MTQNKNKKYPVGSFIDFENSNNQLFYCSKFCIAPQQPQQGLPEWHGLTLEEVRMLCEQFPEANVFWTKGGQS